MRHGARTQRFNRPFNQRKWLMRNLAVSLVEHERISTTLAKAKELRRVVEKAVTLGKKGTLAHRRLLMSRIPNTDLVQKVFTVLAPRYSTRQGGYTRIYRMMRRPGDNAEMAIIEFIDAQLKQSAPVEKGTKSKKKAAEGAVSEKSAERKAKAAAAKVAKKEARAAKAQSSESKKEAKPKAKKAKSK